MKRQTLTADGETGSINNDTNQVQIIVEGTLGGGTVTMEYSLDDQATWATFPGVTLTAIGSYIVELYMHCHVRLALDGSTTPSATLTLVSAK